MEEEYWIHALLAVMVLLNFFLNLTSVYLGRYKKDFLENHLQHIIFSIFHAYEGEENTQISELEKKISKDKANFETWDSPKQEE